MDIYFFFFLDIVFGVFGVFRGLFSFFDGAVWLFCVLCVACVLCVLLLSSFLSSDFKSSLGMAVAVKFSILSVANLNLFYIKIQKIQNFKKSQIIFLILIFTSLSSFVPGKNSSSPIDFFILAVLK